VTGVLAATVYLKDPDTQQWVTLPAGSVPEPRLARLVTNPAAWTDGRTPQFDTGDTPPPTPEPAPAPGPARRRKSPASK